MQSRDGEIKSEPMVVLVKVQDLGPKQKRGGGGGLQERKM